MFFSQGFCAAARKLTSLFLPIPLTETEERRLQPLSGQVHILPSALWLLPGYFPPAYLILRGGGAPQLCMDVHFQVRMQVKCWKRYGFCSAHRPKLLYAVVDLEDMFKHKMPFSAQDLFPT